MMRFITPIIFIVLSVAIFFGYIDSTYEEIKVVKAEVAEYDEALEQSRRLQDLRDDLLVTYNNFDADDLERLKKLLPDNVDNVRLILDIDSIASKYGMTLRGMSVSESTSDSVSPNQEEEGVGTIGLSFSVTTSYENFKLFLEDLERSLRLVDVVSLSFSASDVDLYQYSVNLRTYWLK